MRTASRHSAKNALRAPAGIVLLYILFAMLWIVASDRMLGLLWHDSGEIQRMGTLKGFLFIAVTGALLYLLLKNWHASLARAFESAGRYRERLERVLDSTDDGWWDWDLARGEIYYSPRWWRMLGYAPDELPATPRLWQQLTHPDDLQHARRIFEEALEEGTQSYTVELRMRCKDGSYLPVLTRYQIRRNAAGRPLQASGANMDLSERKRVEKRLQQAAAIFEATREGVLVTDAEQRITMVNNAFTEISGYSEAEVIGKLPSMLGSGRHDAAFYSGMWQSLAETGHWQGEIWNRRKSGEFYPELLSISMVRDAAGAVVNYVGVFADLSKIKYSESQIEFLAHYDPLTQLPNRRQLLSHLEHALLAARRENRQLALLTLDLDRFKDVNDSFGHGAGDELLRQVADQLSAHLQGMDAVARLGGDEFTVMLRNLAQPEDAALLANELIGSLGKPWTLSNGATVRIGASIGISIFPDHGTTTDALLQHADAALYQAKSEGRSCFRYFSRNLTQAARERIELDARLHRALEQNELRVYYQPQIDIASGRIVGAEALVRWQDPREGLIPPPRFIPVAEATGLIGAIGEWVLRETCRQGKEWMETGLPPLSLSVNLSPRQFLRGDLGAMVAAILAETGFPAKRLELELTESALMNPQEEVAALLNGLRALGVRLALDDFGTGYSSLAHLKRFPLDVLKIDKSFVDDIPHGQDDVAIASAIVAMGHSLGFQVLAEGVENAEQLAFLKSLGCDLYQGYLASRPVPAADFARLLKASAPP